MRRRDLFDIKVKQDGQPIVKAFDKTFEEIEGIVKNLKHKFK